MTLRPLFAVASALLVVSCTDSAPAPAAVVSPQSVVDSLLAADRAFAAAGDSLEIVDALTPMFASDVIMPLPGGQFAEGRDSAVAAMRANSANTGARMKWAPIRGGVSADGQHGFTFGYMTVVERAFSDEAQTIGLRRAFQKYGSADAVNVGGAPAFTLGAQNIGNDMFADTAGSEVSWAPTRVIVASSGDLGITIGLIRENQTTPDARAFSFFTIWRRPSSTAPWLYVAE